MDAEIYIDNNSFIHRLDPRVKISYSSDLVCLAISGPLWMLPITV